MAVHLLNLILITTTTTTITKFACGELFLKMPLTINPVVQDAITERSMIVKHFYRLNTTFFSRLSPADIVMTLNNSLSFVMRKNVVGALVLGVAAKSAGLGLERLHYNPDNKWTINISLTDIESVLSASEKRLLPLADNITLVALQNIGLRFIEKRFNVSLVNVSESLYSSTALTYRSILQDWIRVVNFITKANVKRLADSHRVPVSKIAEALQLTTGELYGMTLQQLDGLLSTRFEFVEGSLQVVDPTVLMTSTATTAQTPTDTRTTTVQATEPVSSTSLPETTLTHLTTKRETPTRNPPMSETTSRRSTVSKSPATTIVGNHLTDKDSVSSPTDQNAISAVTTDANSIGISTTTEVDHPTQNSSAGKKDGMMNLALFVGVPVAVLLLLVASLTFWCFKRKRRGSGDSKKKKKKKKNNNANINMNNFWVEKNDVHEVPESIQDKARQEGNVPFVRRFSGTVGLDSRFKGLKYVTASTSTFSPEPPSDIVCPKIDLEDDSRPEIFV